MAGEKDERNTDSFDRVLGANSASRDQDDFLRGVEKVAGADSEAPDQTPLSQRIADLRGQRGLSKADLAQRTGLSEADVTAIEEGTLSPPLGLLIKLGKALEAELGTLFATGRKVPYAVVRLAQRAQVHRRPAQGDTSYGYSYEHLAKTKCDRTMEPFVVTLRPNAEPKPPSSHDGEEFIFVLSGRMEALVGDDTITLDPGDSIYYDSSVPHLVRAVGDEPTQILAVLTSRAK